MSLYAEKPLFIEIGCGKGHFLDNISQIYPDRSFLGVEQYESVLLHAIKRCEISKPSNLLFICIRADHLLEIFHQDEVDGIFLNFSDPWPKKRHAKRRLTSPVFLNIYHHILKPGAKIEFKTDNTDLFAYSLEQIDLNPGFELLSHTRDLYAREALLKGNIPTEYELKFHSMGKPICKLVAEKKP